MPAALAAAAPQGVRILPVRGGPQEKRRLPLARLLMDDRARTGAFDKLHAQPGCATQYSSPDARLRHLRPLFHFGEPEGVAVPVFTLATTLAGLVTTEVPP